MGMALCQHRSGQDPCAPQPEASSCPFSLPLQGDAGMPGVDGRPGLEGFPGPQVRASAPQLHPPAAKTSPPCCGTHLTAFQGCPHSLGSCPPHLATPLATASTQNHRSPARCLELEAEVGLPEGFF